MRRAPLIAMVLAACTEPPPPATTVLDLSRETSAPRERIPLVSVPMATQADFDRLEERFLETTSAAELARALAAYANAQGKPSPLLLQRIALLVSDDLQPTGAGLQPTLDASTRLREAAAEDPHTLWLNGWVLWRLLGDGKVPQLGAEQKPLVEAIQQQWKLLLERAPDYVGPRGHGASLVRADLARLDAAIAAAAAPSPPAGAVVEPRPATVGELAALAGLEDFRAATDGNRRGICRDWREREPTSPRSLLERRMDLGCATLAGDAQAAVALIAGLRSEEGPAFDACDALSRLAERASAQAIAQARKLVDIPCP